MSLRIVIFVSMFLFQAGTLFADILPPGGEPKPPPYSSCIRIVNQSRDLVFVRLEAHPSGEILERGIVKSGECLQGPEYKFNRVGYFTVTQRHLKKNGVGKIDFSSDNKSAPVFEGEFRLFSTPPENPDAFSRIEAVYTLDNASDNRSLVVKKVENVFKYKNGLPDKIVTRKP